MKLTGAQVVWESLVCEGVETIFGIPGGGVIHLYHALPEYPIHHVLMRHELAAAHAADGYARTTGKVGVCISTSGPGATNLVTGLATALRDSSPVVAITGQAHSWVLGTDAFQELDITGITLPITKHNYLVTVARELPGIIREAFFIARTGRPGPVLISISTDVQVAAIDYVYPNNVRLPGYRPTELHSLVEEEKRSARLSHSQEGQAKSAQSDIVAQETDVLLRQYIVDQIRQATQDQAVLISDEGKNRIWEPDCFARDDRGCVLSSEGFGTRGLALSAAIGAQMGLRRAQSSRCPDKQVWVITDDGSFQMTIHELATVVQERLPLKIAILNSGYPDVTPSRQALFPNRRYSSPPLVGPDLVQLAEAYGITGLTAREKSELAPAIAHAVAIAGPVLVDCHVLQMTLATTERKHLRKGKSL